MKEPVEVDINAKFLHNGYFTTSDSNTNTDAISAADSDDKTAGVAYHNA
jgi:hypothetical protein